MVDFLETDSPSEKLILTRASQKDARVKRAIELAKERGVLIEVTDERHLDEVSQSASHQGCALVVPPFAYTQIEHLLSLGQPSSPSLPSSPSSPSAPASPALLVGLDGVSDPQNLGAVIRSAEAFGAKGVVIPERRSAQVNPTVWKASAGALARLPVAKVVNLSRTIDTANELGFQSVGLDAKANMSIDEVKTDYGDDPIFLIAGAEGAGLARLVKERCTLLARVPHRPSAASLNVSVSVGIALYVLANKLD